MSLNSKSEHQEIRSYIRGIWFINDYFIKKCVSRLYTVFLRFDIRVKCKQVTCIERAGDESCVSNLENSLWFSTYRKFSDFLYFWPKNRPDSSEVRKTSFCFKCERFPHNQKIPQKIENTAEFEMVVKSQWIYIPNDIDLLEYQLILTLESRLN